MLYDCWGYLQKGCRSPYEILKFRTCTGPVIEDIRCRSPYEILIKDEAVNKLTLIISCRSPYEILLRDENGRIVGVKVAVLLMRFREWKQEK